MHTILSRQLGLIPTLAVLTALPAFAVGQTMEEAIRLMMAHEPELLAAHADTHSTDADFKIARGALLPQVSVEGRGGAVNRDRSLDGRATGAEETLFSRQIGISLRQLVFDAGAGVYQARSARHVHGMQLYLERSMVERRVVDLAEVYLEVLRTDLQIAEAKRNIAVHDRIRRQVEDRVGVGGTRADVSLVDDRRLSARDYLVAQELAQQRAHDRFQRLVGRAPGNMVMPRVPMVPADRGEVDLSQNWDYLSAQRALLAAEDKYAGVRRDRLPKVYLDTGVSRGEDVQGVDGADDEARAILTMQWDLFRGGIQSATEQREGWQVIRAHELLRAADLERNYQLTLLWRERAGDQAAVASLREQTELLSRVAGDYEEQFKVGKQDLLDILDVWNRYYDARKRLIDAEFNLNTGAFRVLGVQGQLVEQVMGEGVWEELDGELSPKRVITEVHAEDLIPHPHHPEAADSDSMHHFQDEPHEGWAVDEPEQQNRGWLGKLLPDPHQSESPREPRGRSFGWGKGRVSTRTPGRGGE